MNAMWDLLCVSYLLIFSEIFADKSCDQCIERISHSHIFISFPSISDGRKGLHV